MSRQLEICADSVQSARAAQAGGASRIELCQDLAQGGTTPSIGLLRQVRALLTIPVFVLIRPRPGNFVYDADERAIMAADVRACREAGCDGVVFGLLDPAGCVNMAQCRELLAVVGPLPVTFHRAFDECPDQPRALEDIIALGCQRVLTSGGAATASAGQDQLARLVAQAAGRLSVMPGAGITAQNLPALAARTGAQEFHTSAKVILPPLPSGPANLFQATRYQTDAAQVAELMRLLRA